MQPRNHFATLGVGLSATEADIKKAYRRLAMQYHPDRNPGDDQAVEFFKEVQESYAYLCDNMKRQILADQLRRQTPEPKPQPRKPMTEEERLEWIRRNDPNMGNIIDVEPPPFQFGPKREETKFVDAYAKYYTPNIAPDIRALPRRRQPEPPAPFHDIYAKYYHHGNQPKIRRDRGK